MCVCVCVCMSCVWDSTDHAYQRQICCVALTYSNNTCFSHVRQNCDCSEAHFQPDSNIPFQLTVGVFKRDSLGSWVSQHQQWAGKKFLGFAASIGYQKSRDFCLRTVNIFSFFNLCRWLWWEQSRTAYQRTTRRSWEQLRLTCIRVLCQWWRNWSEPEEEPKRGPTIILMSNNQQYSGSLLSIGKSLYHCTQPNTVAYHIHLS